MLRTSDLQEPEFAKAQRFIECPVAQSDPRSMGYFLWSTPGPNGYIWDGSDSPPVLIKGLGSEGIHSCSVSPDKSKFVVVRKGEAELWGFSGKITPLSTPSSRVPLLSDADKKLVALESYGGVKQAGWTLQGSVLVVRDTGAIILIRSGWISSRYPPTACRFYSLDRQWNPKHSFRFVRTAM